MTRGVDTLTTKTATLSITGDVPKDYIIPSNPHRKIIKIRYVAYTNSSDRFYIYLTFNRPVTDSVADAYLACICRQGSPSEFTLFEDVETSDHKCYTGSIYIRFRIYGVGDAEFHVTYLEGNQ